MKTNEFPPGWDVDRVQRILTHYEPRQDTPVFNPLRKNIIAVPKELVPAVQELIAKYGTA